MKSDEGGEMDETKERQWLSDLPTAGYDIVVLYKDDSVRTVPWGRLIADGNIIHINLLEKSGEETQPTIGGTLHIHQDDVEEITFREYPDSPEIRIIRRQDAWLGRLPKSRKCHVFLTCKNWIDCKEINTGWIEYDDKRIYLNEIVGSRKSADGKMDIIESVRHERHIKEVISVLVTIEGRSPEIFVRVIRKKPDYKS